MTLKSFTCFLIVSFTIPHVLTQLVNFPVPMCAARLPDNYSVDHLQGASSCLYNISINLAAVFLPGIDMKAVAQMAGGSAAEILDRAFKEGEKNLNQQFFGPKSERLATEFDDDDTIERNHFIDVHFPDDGFDPNDLISAFSNTSDIVKDYAKISGQSYRALENILDAVGEADDEFFARTELHFNGTTLISESLNSSDATLKTNFSIRAQQILNSTLYPNGSKNMDVELLISSDLEDVLSSIGVSKLQMQMSETLDNPFFDDTSAIIRTPILSVIMKDYTPGREHLPINLEGVEKPFEFWMPLEHVTGQDDPGTLRVQRNLLLANLTDQDIQPFHLILPHNALVFVEIVDPKVGAEYTVLYLKDYWPTRSDFCGNYSTTVLNSSSVPASMKFITEKSNFSQSSLIGEQNLDYYVAIYMNYPAAPQSSPVDFRVRFTRLSCLFRDEDSEFWSEKGCVVGEDSTLERLHCYCNHASIFAGTQFTIPNDLETISVFDFRSQDFHDNPIIMSTVCVLLGIYIIAMIICYLLDRRDGKKVVGITIMTDLGGDPHHHYYLITVITGNRLGAGTTASVCLQLYGTQGRSQVYVLREPSTPVLNRGGIDSFLVSSETHLGDIERIRIWHDNSGNSPNWYCRKVIVKYVKSDVEWLFFVENWLRITGKQSTIIYEQNLATPKEFASFRRRFFKNFVDHLDKSHLWLSVIRHPTASRFTRCQRLSCAFAILTLYLLSNIIMYGIEVQDPDDPYGLQSYVIAAQMSLLEVPFGCCIIYMFWLIRQRHIPTLIIWRKHPQLIQSRPRGSVFIPKSTQRSTRASLKPRNTIIVDESSGDAYNNDNDNNDAGTEASETFSIPSTNVEDFEGWVAAYHGDDRGQYIRSMRDHDDAMIQSDDQVGWGRMGLVHAIRSKHPHSFVYSGDNDVPDVENLMNEEIKRHLLRPSTGDGSGGDGQNNTKRFKIMEQQVFDRGDGFLDPDFDSDDVEIAFETCEMKPQRTAFFKLPWWFIFIAWTICLASICIFLYFTLLYGLHYGYLRSLDWLLRVALSFLISVFIVQPINILICAFIFTVACTPKNWSIVDEERFQILSTDRDTFGKRKPIMMKVFEAERKHPPLSDATIFEIKIAARRWNRVKNAMGELLFYVFLLIPLLIFVYAGRSPDDLMLVRNMRCLLETNRATADINSPEELYKYLKTVVAPALYPAKLYNGKNNVVTRYGVVEIDDHINYLIGVPRIRQVRAPKEKCHVPTSVKDNFKNCYFYYDISTQEKGTYYEFWLPVKNLTHRKLHISNDIWKFRGNETDHAFIRSRDIRGHKGIYDGGGYVAELGRTYRQTKSVLKYMKRTNWIDQQTRSVFVEFTIYNPNMNRFLNVVIFIERGPSHSFETSFQITPVFLTIDDDLEGLSWVKVSFFSLIIAAVLLVLNLIWIICFSSELRLCQQYWFWLNIVMIVGIVTSLSVSVKKYYVMENITETIQLMKVNEYVNLQEIAYWDGVQSAAFSITQCICFLKIWRLLVFLEGGFLVTSLTVRLASHMIFAFSFVVLIVLVGFTCAGYIFFGGSMAQFSTLGNTFLTLIGQSLHVTIFDELYLTNRIIGPIYGSVYGFVSNILFLNLLIAILNQSMIEAKMLANEKFRNWGIAESIVHHIFRRHGHQPATSALVELQPDRLEGLKKSTAELFRAALRSEDAQKMKKIKLYAKYLLEGTDYYLLRRQPANYYQEFLKERKMDEMRLQTAEFLKARMGTEMSVEEMRKYNDINKTIVSLRIFKLEKAVNELQRKLKRYRNDEVVFQCRSENGVITFV